jgi:hypothetical protein
MTTHFEVYKENYTGSGMENLLLSLQALASESHPSVVNLQLIFSTKENELDTWLLKNLTVVQLSD